MSYFVPQLLNTLVGETEADVNVLFAAMEREDFDPAEFIAPDAVLALYDLLNRWAESGNGSPRPWRSRTRRAHPTHHERHSPMPQGTVNPA